MNKQHQSRTLRGAQAERRHTITHQGGPHVKVELSLRSELSAISPFVDTLMQLIGRCRWASGNEREIEIALREALANAIVHGNHEDPTKHVYVGCLAGTDEVSLVIRDEGHGFDHGENIDPTDPNNLESSHGRGIYLMESLMDEVHFERGGAVVYMRKSARKDPPPRISVDGNNNGIHRM
jgi:serine/threonine-protein kinase RsbW